MTRSIAFATLFAAALAGCAQRPATPAPPVTAADAGVTGFISYCGPIWSVDRQGYVRVPCPEGTNYDTLQ